MNVGGLFDGIGLLAYGLHLAGLEHRWLCEVDPWRRELLAKRWPGVSVFNDVRAVGADTAERVDVIAGGFPCKGASSAGKRNGFDHPETVLWREMARAVRELRPRYVVVENVANILALKDGAVWGEVLGDLATLGFDVVWDCFPAAAFGAPHLRDRVVAIASNSDGPGRTSGREPECPEQARDGYLAHEDPSGPTADANSSRVRPQPEPQRRSSHQGESTPTGSSTSDACRGRQPEHAQRDSERGRRLNGTQRADLVGRGVPVEWGNYKPAVGRWEAVVGPAPEPLVRRVDDRRTMRVERSRLSALGDGVQVQLGRMVGDYLMSLR